MEKKGRPDAMFRAHRKLVLIGLLFLLWSAAALVHFLWRDVLWLLVALAVVTAGTAILGLVLLTLRGLRGYWIEYVSSGALQAEEGDFGVVYHEGSRELMFLGVQRPKPAADVLFIPPETSWNSRVEPWAQRRRAQIVARLLRDPLVRRCEIRSSSLP